VTYTTIVLLVLLICLAYLTRNSLLVKRAARSGMESHTDPVMPDSYEDTSSFMMGGTGGVADSGDYFREPTKADCVSALMIMLSETDELSESFTDTDLTDYAGRADSIFRRAMSIQKDDRTLNSDDDFIAVLWALVSQRPRSQWLAERLPDLGSRLGLDISELITKSLTVDTAKLLGENWKEEAKMIVSSVRSEIKAFAPDELNFMALKIVEDMLKTSKSIPMKLDAYESRSFETWGHFNWNGHFIAQEGLALVGFQGNLDRDKIITEEYVLQCDYWNGGFADCYLASGPDGLEHSIEDNLANISFDILVGQTTLYLGTPWHVWKNSPYSYTYISTDSMEIKEYSKGERDITSVPVVADIKECYVEGPKVISSDDGSNRQEHHWYPYPRFIQGPTLRVFSIGSGSNQVKFDLTEGNLDEVLAFLGVIRSTYGKIITTM
jgi:hypothetical protein